MINGEDGQLLLERVNADDATVLPEFNETGAARLDHALMDLPPHYREVIALRYLEEKSYDEISDILELPPGTVATRIRRGLQHLKSFYAVRVERDHQDHA